MNDIQGKLKNLSMADKIIGIGLVVMLLGVFLPWFTASSSCSGDTCALIGGGSTSNSTSLLNDWGYLYLFGFLVLAIFWLIKTFFAEQVKLPAKQGKLSDLPVSDKNMLLGAAAVALLGALLFVLNHHNDTFSRSTAGFSTSASFGFGLWIGIIGSIISLVGAVQWKSSAIVGGSFSSPTIPPTA